MDHCNYDIFSHVILVVFQTLSQTIIKVRQRVPEYLCFGVRSVS